MRLDRVHTTPSGPCAGAIGGPWSGATRRTIIRSIILAASLISLMASAAPRQRPSPAPSPAIAARLQALDPAQPIEYLRLAEEIEARAKQASERQLARELYGLAGALDPRTLGAAAALAQAGLAESAAERARLVRLATALGAVSRRPTTRDATMDSSTARFAQLLAAYRRGQGVRARELMSQPEVAELVDRHGPHFEGGAAGFRNAVASLRDQPVERQERLLELMWIELALVGGGGDPASDLLRTGGEPLIACDPLDPGSALGVDRRLARWRDGAWRE